LGGGSAISDDAVSTDTDAFQVVEIVAVDEVIPPDRPVSIIQLDVEGYEQPALQGAMRTIRKWRPVIVLEVWEQSDLVDSPWFANEILALGYRQTATIHGNRVFEYAGTTGGSA